MICTYTKVQEMDSSRTGPNEQSTRGLNEEPTEEPKGRQRRKTTKPTLGNSQLRAAQKHGRKSQGNTQKTTTTAARSKSRIPQGGNL